MILSLIGSIVHFLVNAYILVLFIRMILDWVAVLAPRGLVASLIDAIYQLTEPPLRWLRQYIRPIPMGPIYFDVAFIVLYFILIVIDFLI